MSIQFIGLILFALGVPTWVFGRSSLTLPFRGLWHGAIPRHAQRLGVITSSFELALFLGLLLVALAYNGVMHGH